MLEEGEGLVAIAPDDLHKADTSGGDPYQAAVPDLGADGKLLNEQHQLFGFSGYEGIDRGIPTGIATLSEGLLKF